jgi:hypothetical protein
MAGVGRGSEGIGTSYVAVNADFMDTRAPAVAALIGK